METMQEVQNRMEFLKLMDEGEEDRMSELPDCLILEILARLPFTEYAIRTCILSKRWKHLWTSVHTLIFGHSYSFSTLSVKNPKHLLPFVDKTLIQRRQLKLKKFQVNTYYDNRFERQFHNWIRYAISCNVEELYLWFPVGEREGFVLNQFFFISSCFTDLTLRGCILNPTGPISWKNLRSLCIHHGKINEESVENILSGSPVLETLELHYYYGYRLLNITSKSVKNLVFSGYINPEDVYVDVDNAIEINAPYISSIAIKDLLFLRKLLLLNVSSLVEANLDYRRYKYASDSERDEEMKKGLILKLRHVKELKIGPYCYDAMCRLKAKGFVFPSNIKYYR